MPGRGLSTLPLTGLADEEADVVSEDGRVAVQEVAGQLHHDRKFRQLLQDLPGLGTRSDNISVLPLELLPRVQFHIYNLLSSVKYRFRAMKSKSILFVTVIR